MTSTPRRPQVSESDSSRIPIDDEVIGTDLGNIIDPEIFQGPSNSPDSDTHEMSFLTAIDVKDESRPWTFKVVRMDPETGKPELETQLEVNNHFNFLKAILQGPEWGYCETEGRSLFYTAVDENGVSQIGHCAHSREDGWLQPVMLNTGDHEGNLVVSSASLFKKSSIQVLFGNYKLGVNGEGRLPLKDLGWRWLDTGDTNVPKTLHEINAAVRFRVQPPVWVAPRVDSERCDLIFGSNRFESVDLGEDGAEILRYNADNGAINRLTDEPGYKVDPQTFVLDGSDKRTYIVPVANNQEADLSTIRVYEQPISAPFGHLKQLNEFTIPYILDKTFPDGIPEDLGPREYSIISCIEPIVTKTKAYIAMRIAKDNSVLPDNNHSLFIVMDVDGNDARLVSKLPREGGMDQEILYGKQVVYLYYNVYTPKRWRAVMHKCNTYVEVDE